MSEITETVIEMPAGHEQNIFGQLDANLKKIEHALGVTVTARDGSVRIEGSREAVLKARQLFDMLLAISRRGNEITDQNLAYSLSLVSRSGASEPETARQMKDVVSMNDDVIIHTMAGRPVCPKTLGQKQYVDSIRKQMITFGIGPAGTGKTYLAMAMAIRAFREEEVSRIILTRPAIEAGEKLGFLPGDLQSKIDPYLRPLYDALYEIMGAEAFLRNSEKGLIEVAPLAYMRGRTLDNAFIILDEAQNTTPSQMKMFLTRIGFGSKVVVTGDRTQKDLPSDQTSGLDVASRVLRPISEIGFCELTSRDVVRHPLVQKIVEAYETYEKKESARKEASRRQPGKRRTRYERR
ncbi:MAG: PhoH family protein [Eubacteriales bacterium]|jgi:phosphate starvation-inducible PhoH-like protein